MYFFPSSLQHSTSLKCLDLISKVSGSRFDNACLLAETSISGTYHKQLPHPNMSIQLLIIRPTKCTTTNLIKMH